MTASLTRVTIAIREVLTFQPTHQLTSSSLSRQHLQEQRSSAVIMCQLLLLVAFSALASASVVQQKPLQQASDAQALINSKPPITSEAIQDLITRKNLEKRAKELYKIAELSLDEYNHPTRVIGSPGKLQHNMPTLETRMLMTMMFRALGYSRLHLLYHRRARRLL